MFSPNLPNTQWLDKVSLAKPKVWHKFSHNSLSHIAALTTLNMQLQQLHHLFQKRNGREDDQTNDCHHKEERGGWRPISARIPAVAVSRPFILVPSTQVNSTTSVALLTETSFSWKHFSDTSTIHRMTFYYSLQGNQTSHTADMSTTNSLLSSLRSVVTDSHSILLSPVLV